MKSFRTFLFWVHLVAGVISGVAIGIMCFTGIALAFEKELAAWHERDARRVAVPAESAARITLDDALAQLRKNRPEFRATTLVVQNDPAAAIGFPAGRTAGAYVNPYTGEVKEPASYAMAKFLGTMLNWHRYLNFTSDTTRPRGKLVNGICNVAFCVLALTGLYLWMPRSWSWRAVRPAIWFAQNRSSKARDWNWHNAIGFWCAPVLIVLTLTAMPISFRWASNFLYTVTGTPQPAPAAAAPAANTSTARAPATANANGATASLQVLFENTAREIPAWQTMTFRLSGSGAPGGADPVSVSVREKASWPRTATTTAQLDPVSGALLKREGYPNLDAARRLRSWTRYLHTGEAVGPVGQVIAGVACIGGCVLVYTGLALAWRRFFGRKSSAAGPNP